MSKKKRITSRPARRTVTSGVLRYIEGAGWDWLIDPNNDPFLCYGLSVQKRLHVPPANQAHKYRFWVTLSTHQAPNKSRTQMFIQFRRGKPRWRDWEPALDEEHQWRMLCPPLMKLACSLFPDISRNMLLQYRTIYVNLWYQEK